MDNNDIFQISVYFDRKGREWISQSKTIEDYIKKSGIKGLSQEFMNDSTFAYVCSSISRLNTIQLRSGIAKGLEEDVGLLFGIPLLGTMDIIIGAIEEACGKRVAGELIAKGITTVVVGVLIIGVLGAITK